MSSKNIPAEEKLKEEKGVVKSIPTPIKEKIIKETIKEEDLTKNERIKLMKEKIIANNNSIILDASQMESLIKLFQVLQISDFESDNLDDEQRNVIQNMCNILGINLVFTDDGFCEPVDFSEYEGEEVDYKIMPSTKVKLPDDLLGDVLVTLDGYDRELSASVLRIDKAVHKKMASLMTKPIETINMVDDYISLLGKIQCYDISIEKELRDNMTDVVEKLRTFVMKYIDDKNVFYSKKFNEVKWEAIELAKREGSKGNRRVEAMKRLEKSKKKQEEGLTPDDLDEKEDGKTAKEKMKKKKKKSKRDKDSDDDEKDKKKKRKKRKSSDDEEDEKDKKKKKRRKKEKDSDDDDDEDRKSKRRKKDKDKKKSKKKRDKEDDEDEDEDRKTRKKKKKKSKKNKDKDKGDGMNYLKIDIEDVKDIIDDILEKYDDDLKDINKKLLKDMENVSDELGDDEEDAVPKALALMLITLNSVKLDKKIKKAIIELTSLGDLDDEDEDDEDDNKKSRRKKKKSKKSKKRNRDDDDEDDDEEEDRKSRKKKKKKKNRRDKDNDEKEKGGNKMSKKTIKNLKGAAKKFKKALKEADLYEDMQELVEKAEDGKLKSKHIKTFLKDVKKEDKKLFKKLSAALEKSSSSKESEEVDNDEIAAIIKKMVKNHEDVLDDADLLDDAEELLEAAEDEEVDFEDVKDFIEALEEDKDCRKEMKKLIKKLKSAADSDEDDDDDDDDDRKSRRRKKDKKKKNKKKSRRNKRDRDDEDDEDDIDYDDLEDEIGKSEIKDIKKMIKNADLKDKVESKMLDFVDDSEYEDLIDLAKDKSAKLTKKLVKYFRGLARVSGSSEDIDYFIGDQDEDLDIVYSIDDVEETDEFENASDINSKLLKVTHEPSGEELDVPIIVFNRRTVKNDPRFK